MSLNPQYLYNIDRISNIKQYPKESNLSLLITNDELYKLIILKLNKKGNKDNLRIRIFNLLLFKKIREITNKINLKPMKPCYVCSRILHISMYSNRQLKNGALRKCPPCAHNAIQNNSHKNTIYV